MRVLLLHNNYTVHGGAEVFFHEIGRLLEKNGHTVAKFCCAEVGLDAPYEEHFPQVPHYAEGGLIAKAARVPSIIYNRMARDGMGRVIDDFKPDIIHGFAIYSRLTPSVLEAAKAANVPAVLSCNDYKHICPNYKLFHHGKLCEDCKGGKFYSAILNRCCHDSLAVSTVSALEAYSHARRDIWRKNIDCFLFASRFMERKTQEFWGKGLVETDILQNPFDAQEHHVPLNAGKSLLYFGRLIEEKGVEVLIEAAGRCPDVPVVIIGDGPDREKLGAAAASLANVEFVGPIWGNNLKRFLHDARAVVVPSLWHENFPYVILQAFAAGKPVIGSRRGGIPELVEAGPHGWLFEPTKVEELVQIMHRAAQLPDGEVLHMGAQAQKFVAASFNDDAIYAELKRIYSKVGA